MAARLAALPKEPRKVHAGPAISAKKCDLCAEDILRGGTEYEVEFAALTIRLDLRCFTLWWQSEMVKK